MSALRDDLRPVRRVAVVGGTHGNERNGVLLARHFLANPERAARPSFETLTLLANPHAIKANARYVDEDMNRCFLKDKLAAPAENREAVRAREVDAILGPKSSDERAIDLVIDLHNTTSDCGYALMMARGDALSHGIAAHLKTAAPIPVRCCEWAEAADHAVLPSTGRAGFTLEVGPVACGIADATTYANTLQLVHAILDYVEARNVALAAGTAAFHAATIPCYRRVDAVDFPRDGDGEVAGLIHPNLEDFRPVVFGQPLFLDTDSNTVIKTHLGPPLTPFFINEAAYYEKGVAFVLAETVEVEVDVLTQ